MAFRLKVGTVISQGDITNTGKFDVAFKLSDGYGSVEEPVSYVTPYGSTEAAFVAIPMVGSQVLCAYEDDVTNEGQELCGYYYLGSVMGAVPGINDALPTPSDDSDNFIGPPAPPAPAPPKYVPKDKPGTFGPPVPPGQSAEISSDWGREDEVPSWPTAFKDMYDAKGVIPEAIGLTNYRGDTFKITSKFNLPPIASNPFQNMRIGMYSGSGKKIELVDSPIVNGIVMSNEHKGKDFFIWSSAGSKDSPFSEGEYHMRTHGPVNLYTLVNNFHIWVEDGLNIEIENKSTPSKSYGPGINADPTGGGMKGQGTSTGDYSTRKGQYGNESTGCIQLKSWYNNISLQAEASDSVVYIEAPGDEAKVIVDCGGSVDIVSQGKATIQSNTQVKVTAPLVDINGTKKVEVTAPELSINGTTSLNLISPFISMKGKMELDGMISLVGTHGGYDLNKHVHSGVGHPGDFLTDTPQDPVA